MLLLCNGRTPLMMTNTKTINEGLSGGVYLLTFIIVHQCLLYCTHTTLWAYETWNSMSMENFPAGFSCSYGMHNACYLFIFDKAKLYNQCLFDDILNNTFLCFVLTKEMEENRWTNKPTEDIVQRFCRNILMHRHTISFHLIYPFIKKVKSKTANDFPINSWAKWKQARKILWGVPE